MKIFKNIALVCLLLTLSVSLFACGEVSATKVHDNYMMVVKENPKMFTDSNLYVNLDRDIYTNIKNCGDEYFTDLVNVYEPTTEISMQFFDNYRRHLTETKNIDAKDSTTLNQKLDALEASIRDCATAMDALEYYKSYFMETKGGAYTYSFVNSSTVKNKMRALYDKYDKLIDSAFDFNNYFVYMYTKKYPMVDYRATAVELNRADIKNAYDYTISRVLDVVFDLKDTTDGNAMLNKILRASAKYQSIIADSAEETRVFAEIINNDTRNGEMKAKLQILQNHLDIYLSQKDRYEVAKGKLNSDNLSAFDKNAYTQVVTEFEGVVLTDTVNSLCDIVKALSAV